MIEIRRLSQQDDLSAVAEVYAASWRQHYMGILPDAFLSRLTGDRWSAMLHADPSSSLALFEDGRVMGTAMTGFPRDEERANDGEIRAVYLLPEAKGRGYGRMLLEAAMQSLLEEGCEHACLWVMEPNRSSIGFYEHMGFHPSGRTQQEKYGECILTLLEYIRKL